MGGGEVGRTIRAGQRNNWRAFQVGERLGLVLWMKGAPSERWGRGEFDVTDVLTRSGTQLCGEQTGGRGWVRTGVGRQ